VRLLSWLLLFAACASTAAAQPSAPHVLHGIVRDTTGGAISGAEIQILGPRQRLAGAATTDSQGRFSMSVAEAGAYVLEIRAPGFAESRASVLIPRDSEHPLELTTGAPSLRDEVSVTSTVDRVEPTTRLTQPVNVIDANEIALRAKSVVSEVANEEVGLHLQRTSPVMAGIFIRGLTGNKVNVFVDGVRYSTAAQRGGVSTFIDLIDPALLDSVEVLRGPNSAQYGSDALGGSLQFLSRIPSVGLHEGGRVRGLFSAQGNTADYGVRSTANVSYAGPRAGVIGSVAAQRIGDVRVGGGIDSHAAVTRFLGVRSDLLMPEHLPETGFRQYGVQATANWLPGTNNHVLASYRRGYQDGGKRYDQLLGGDGNLIADLRDLSLDLFFLRYERIGAGWFDEVSATGSINSQYEERVNQGGNGNPRAAINSEPERTNVFGLQGTARKQLGPRMSISVGGDFHPESITAPSSGINPVTGVSSVRRGRVPDGATYRSGGVFGQTVVAAIPSRLQLVGNVRVNGAFYRARAADSPIVNGQPLWPDDELETTGVAFRGGLSATLTETWTVTANLGRGFRAPHITDLGTLGLTGSGFEVAAPDVAGLGGTVGSTADATAVSLGTPIDQVGPESSLTYEGGVHYRSSSVRSTLAIFANEIRDNIAKQSLILPQGAVGRTLGGTPITSQNANGVVFVAAATNPVLVRVNFDNARIIGVEHTFDWRPSAAWLAGTTFTYLRAQDTRTGLPPNIEGGTPAPEANIHLSYTSRSGRWWAGTYLHAATAQDRLSTLDLDDRRTGAGRSRTSIRNFFLNGATTRGYISAGTDNLFGTADDVLIATGETLAQIQDRVLGVGVASAPLYMEVKRFFTAGFRGGVRIGRHELAADFENVTDENYRGVSWGVDAPGRGVSLRYVARF
jgi:outer membrane receptor protein involved in Fe transport